MDLGGITGNINIPALSALLLGLITAISPCPLATNIAAIAYVSRRVKERRYAVITGTLYTLGRMFSYSILGILIIVAGLKIPGVASFLQDFGEQILGPLLIVVVVIMLTINKISLSLRRWKTVFDRRKGRQLGDDRGIYARRSFCPGLLSL